MGRSLVMSSKRIFELHRVVLESNLLERFEFDVNINAKLLGKALGQDLHRLVVFLPEDFDHPVLLGIRTNARTLHVQRTDLVIRGFPKKQARTNFPRNHQPDPFIMTGESIETPLTQNPLHAHLKSFFLCHFHEKPPLVWL